MPQISKRVVAKQIEEKIIETFLEAISQLRNKNDILIFVNDLLTPVEKIMLAKRLAIAVLLLKEWNYEAINNFVKVSNDTIARVARIVKTNDGYRIALGKLSRTEAVREFWQDIVKLAHRLGTRDTFIEEELLDKKLGIKKRTLL